RVDRGGRRTVEETRGIVSTGERRGQIDRVLVDEAHRVQIVGDRGSTFDRELQDASTAQPDEEDPDRSMMLFRGQDTSPTRNRSEHDAAGIGTVDVPHGERRVIRAYGAGTDEDRIGFGSETVDVGSSFGLGDPTATSIGCGRGAV